MFHIYIFLNLGKILYLQKYVKSCTFSSFFIKMNEFSEKLHNYVFLMKMHKSGENLQLYIFFIITNKYCLNEQTYIFSA